MHIAEEIVGRLAHLEKCLLGCLLEFCSRGSAKELDDVIASAASDEFTTTDHREIFRVMVALRTEGKIPDQASLMGKLDDRLMAQVGIIITWGFLPANLGGYLRDLRKARQDLRFSKQREELESLTQPLDQLACVERMRETLLRRDADSWRSIFHTWEEIEHAPPLRFAIKGFLQEAGVTLIGGLAGHGKTLFMLAMAKALLEQSPLFGHEPFSVSHPAKRVLYLIPESSLSPFWSRLQLFRLQQHVKDDRLLVNTLSCREPISLSDSRMLRAAEGADVFLDTAVRFMEGSENDAQDTRPFVQTLFRLLHAGARSITGAHHAPKGFERQDFMTLENILRGSGDIGAMLSTAWGVRQVDATRTAMYVQNVKPRDFQPCDPFILEGRPHLDKTGNLLMLQRPGEAGDLSEHLPGRTKRGLKVTRKDAKVQQVLEMRLGGASVREIEKSTGISKSTVSRLLRTIDDDCVPECPEHGTVSGQHRTGRGNTERNGVLPRLGGFETSHSSGY